MNKLRIPILGKSHNLMQLVKTILPIPGDLVVKGSYSGHNENNEEVLLYFVYPVLAKHYVKWENTEEIFVLAEYSDDQNYGQIDFAPVSPNFPIPSSANMYFFYVNYERYKANCELTDLPAESFRQYLWQITRDEGLGITLWPEHFKDSEEK